MAHWLENVEPLTLHGQIAVPYTWWVGETGSRFLNAIRHEEKILGTRCGRCNTVFVPPRKNCGRCFVDLSEWVELSTAGVITAYTIVRFTHPMHPVDAPFAYASIRLDGADVDLVHVIRENLDQLAAGVRVEAVFKEASQRSGHILDIDCFQIIDPATEKENG